MVLISRLVSLSAFCSTLFTRLEGISVKNLTISSVYVFSIKSLICLSLKSSINRFCCSVLSSVKTSAVYSLSTVLKTNRSFETSSILLAASAKSTGSIVLQNSRNALTSRLSIMILKCSNNSNLSSIIMSLFTIHQ